MGTREKLAALLEKKAKLVLGGGSDKQKKQTGSGNMTARGRIAALLDEGSFIEVGALVSARGEDTASDGVVTGYGTVDGRLVYVYAQDVTVKNGAIGEMHAAKICKMFDMAEQMGAPVVGMLDSMGARLSEGVDAQAALGAIYARVAKASGVVPNISLVLGACTGGSAFAATMSDFVIMNKKGGQLFVNGPAVVAASTGKEAAVDAVGSNKSGNAQFMGEDDAACIAIAQLLLSYLPSNNLSDAMELDCTDDLNRTSEILGAYEEGTDVRVVIAEVADDKALLEVSADYAKNVVTGLIRLNGASVGVVANQPTEHDGVLCGRAMEKAARFVRFCDSFNIPILTFTDVDGFAISAAEEEWGLARKGARLLYAFAEATVPKVNVILNKAYGAGFAAMNSKQLGADVVFAYPTAQIAPANPSIGVGILYAEELKKGQPRAKIEEAYQRMDASPFSAAKRGFVDDVIDPKETRSYVIGAFEMLKSKRVGTISRKHDNMPL